MSDPYSIILELGQGHYVCWKDGGLRRWLRSEPNEPAAWTEFQGSATRWKEYTAAMVAMRTMLFAEALDHYRRAIGLDAEVRNRALARKAERAEGYRRGYKAGYKACRSKLRRAKPKRHK